MITKINLEKNSLEQELPVNALVHPHKFILWLFIVSIVMLFAAFTSAYIVRQSDGNWLYYEYPNLLWINSLILILSSGTMHWALLSAKKDQQGNLKAAISLTTVLGLGFLVGQVMAWGELVRNKVFFAGSAANPSGSFFYVLTGMHGFHLITGLIFLLIVFLLTFQNKVKPNKLNTIEMCATYWHFLDILWLYLLGFLLLNH
jgi:cytochrome c oxidase subunit 3